MPTPDSRPTNLHDYTAQKLYSQFPPRETRDEGVALREEISELRREIAELRALLSPPTSIIITGREAQAIYDQLKGK